MSWGCHNWGALGAGAGHKRAILGPRRSPHPRQLGTRAAERRATPRSLGDGRGTRGPLFSESINLRPKCAGWDPKYLATILGHLPRKPEFGALSAVPLGYFRPTKGLQPAGPRTWVKSFVSAERTARDWRARSVDPSRVDALSSDLPFMKMTTPSWDTQRVLYPRTPSRRRHPRVSVQIKMLYRLDPGVARPKTVVSAQGG